MLQCYHVSLHRSRQYQLSLRRNLILLGCHPNRLGRQQDIIDGDALFHRCYSRRKRFHLRVAECSYPSQVRSSYHVFSRSIVARRGSVYQQLCSPQCWWTVRLRRGDHWLWYVAVLHGSGHIAGAIFRPTPGFSERRGVCWRRSRRRVLQRRSW